MGMVVLTPTLLHPQGVGFPVMRWIGFWFATQPVGLCTLGESNCETMAARPVAQSLHRAGQVVCLRRMTLMEGCEICNLLTFGVLGPYRSYQI
jgi:hypothetical protein